MQAHILGASRLSHFFNCSFWDFFASPSFTGSYALYLFPSSLVPHVPLNSILNITITFKDKSYLSPEILREKLVFLSLSLELQVAEAFKLAIPYSFKNLQTLHTSHFPSAVIPKRDTLAGSYLILGNPNPLGMTVGLEFQKRRWGTIQVPGS